jgi:hypothetical protein
MPQKEGFLTFDMGVKSQFSLATDGKYQGFQMMNRNMNLGSMCREKDETLSVFSIFPPLHMDKATCGLRQRFCVFGQGRGKNLSGPTPRGAAGRGKPNAIIPETAHAQQPCEKEHPWNRQPVLRTQNLWSHAAPEGMCSQNQQDPGRQARQTAAAPCKE